MYSAGPGKREQNPEVAVPRLRPKFKRCENTNLEIEKISFSTFLSGKSVFIPSYEPVGREAEERGRAECFVFGQSAALPRQKQAAEY